MPDARVLIDPSLERRLRLEAWDGLDDRERLELGDRLAGRLRAHGWAVPGPMTLGTFGPPNAPRSILQWREPDLGMTFSLVPGGTLRPGYDEARLALFEEYRLRLDGEWDEEDLGPREYGQVLPFGTEWPCDLRPRDPVQVAPFFLATEPVRPSLPGLQAVSGLPDAYFEPRKRGPYDHPFMGDAIQFPWPRVGPTLEHYGWDLLASVEFEWALRGGSETLFYWGDNLPAFIRPERIPPEEKAAWQASFDEIMSADFDADRPVSWPWFNAFGLAAMLPLPTWCARSEVPGDPAPETIRGGASYVFPWQWCGEWTLLLSAVEQRSEPGYGDDGVIRPAIRLVAGD
ncbi:hypothetical protein P12x_005910 [Tundrisphaera lichenicola]|uniref:hypothetical protein n=1 Tax=Tundrisphaera lichenicola TaxID=2029860 RepID=UPI003EBDAFED